ncbi:hypothetical protein RAS1_33070 [Phycisphaerae bacterium RAS1]|nr:hypothetical protein RAS1_33070 [Phycisphaerae bacterium RAS1]
MSTRDREHSPLRTAAEELRRRSAATAPAAADETARRQRDGLERLYLYWLASTALLIVLVAAPALLLRGALSTQAKRIDEIGRRLEQRIEGIDARVERQTDESGRAPETSRPMEAVRPAPASSPAEEEFEVAGEVISNDAMIALLKRAIGPGPSPDAVLDEDAANEAISLAEQAGPNAPWARGLWLRLAMLAKLCGLNSTAAEWLPRAGHAVPVGFPDYWLLSARIGLVQGDAEEVYRHTRRVFGFGGPASNCAAVLEAAAAAGEFNYEVARAALRRASPIERCPPEYRLIAARVYLVLEEPQLFRSVLPGAVETPQAWRDEWQFLMAVSLIQDGRLVEGQAALKALSGRWAERLPESRPRRFRVVSAAVQPDASDVSFWRNLARQRGAAQVAATAFAQDMMMFDPSRPAGWCQAATMALRGGDVTRAEHLARCALAAEPKFIPAMLLMYEIRKATDDAGALQFLYRASQLDPKRQQPTLMLVEHLITRGLRDEAMAAIRSAIAAHERLPEWLRANSVVQGMFPESELKRIEMQVRMEIGR